MKKLILNTSLTLLANSMLGLGSNFTSFENEYNLGYQFTQMTLINGAQNTVKFHPNSLNMEIEHLFDANIWLDANLNMVVSYDQPYLGSAFNGADTTTHQAAALGQDPFMYSITMRGGYSFLPFNGNMQIIPYAMFGRNANWSASTAVANNYQSLASIDYFLTGGFGLRLGYKLLDNMLIYTDGLYSYNWDQSGAIKSIQTQNPPVGYGKSYAATNYQFTTTIGARYQITKDVELGVSGFWNNYQHQSNIAGVVYIPQNTFGEMISLGMTY